MKDKKLVYILSLCIVPCIFLSSFLIVEVENIVDSFKISTQNFHVRTLIYFTCLPISMRYFGCILKDRNLKDFLCWGLVIFTVSNILSAFTVQWYLFLFFQSINSIADGLIIVCISLIFKLSIIENNLGRAYGIHGAIISLTSASALSIGSTISYYLGWQVVFLMLSISSLLILVLFYKFIPSRIQNSNNLGQKYFLLSGSFKFLIFMLIIFFINFIILQTEIPSFLKISILFFCCLLLTIIIIFDKKFDVQFSIIPQTIFSSSKYSRITLIILLVFLPINIYFTFLPTYLIIKHQISFVILGYFLTVGEIITFVLSPVFGKKVDNNIYVILLSGVFLTIISLCIFFIYTSFEDTWVNILIFSTILMYGVALSMINPAIAKLIVVSTPNQDFEGMIGFYSMVKFFTNSIAAILFNFYVSLNFTKIFLIEYYFLFFTAIFCSLFLIIFVFLLKMHKLKIS